MKNIKYSQPRFIVGICQVFYSRKFINIYLYMIFSNDIKIIVDKNSTSSHNFKNKLRKLKKGKFLNKKNYISQID